MSVYPLYEQEEIAAASGRPLADVTPASLADGSLSAADLQVHGDTLRRQADIARQAGYVQLADNFLRAAELTAVPNEEVLAMYEQLRPGRATFAAMTALAARLEQRYSAPITAAFVREAASVYRQRGLCRQDVADG